MNIRTLMVKKWPVVAVTVGLFGITSSVTAACPPSWGNATMGLDTGQRTEGVRLPPINGGQK